MQKNWPDWEQSCLLGKNYPIKKISHPFSSYGPAYLRAWQAKAFLVFNLNLMVEASRTPGLKKICVKLVKLFSIQKLSNE